MPDWLLAGLILAAATVIAFVLIHLDDWNDLD